MFVFTCTMHNSNQISKSQIDNILFKAIDRQIIIYTNYFENMLDLKTKNK